MRRKIEVLMCALAFAWAHIAGQASAGPSVSPVPGSQCGVSAWYEHTTPTASDEIADPASLAAAHRTLAFGTMIRVENLDNGRSVEVRINDRGPFGGGRILDLTRAAAEEIGMIEAGTAKVRITPLELLDDESLSAGGDC